LVRNVKDLALGVLWAIFASILWEPERTRREQ